MKTPILTVRLVILGVCLAWPLSASGDDWNMSITVDNQYDIYFGDQFLTTPNFVGGNGNWTDTETWPVTGVIATDFLYVATASDHSVAQGFIGEFTNVTTSSTFVTNDDAGTPWEVFPAGEYLPALNAIESSIPATTWPISVQPSTPQVQTAVTYATTNNLWVTPTSAPGYDDGSSPYPWGGRPGIPANAEWIWYDTGLDPGSTLIPAPFDGFNHAEFLVFRIPGVPTVIPEPATATLLLSGLAGALALRRRRINRKITNASNYDYSLREKNMYRTASILALCLIVSLVTSSVSTAIPISVTHSDQLTCDTLFVPNDLHELGIGFPFNETISAFADPSQVFACPTDDPTTPNALVVIFNGSGLDWDNLWYVSDPETTLSNVDGLVNGQEAFKIDMLGINRSLIAEIGVVDGIFQAGETWEFIIDDYSNSLGLSAADFLSVGLVGSASAGVLSSGSIIATRYFVPEPASIMLLSLAAIGLVGFVRRGRGTRSKFALCCMSIVAAVVFSSPQDVSAATINGDLEPITPFTTYVGDDGVLSTTGNTYWNSLPTTTSDLLAEDSSPTPVDYIFQGAINGTFAGASGHDLYDEGYNEGIRFRIADLTPGNTYDMAFYLSSPAGSPGAQVEVFHNSGIAIQTQSFASTDVTPGTAGQEYLLFSGLYPYNTGIDGWGFDIAMDNPFGVNSAMVGFQIEGKIGVVPEPASLMLISLAAFGLVGFARRFRGRKQLMFGIMLLAAGLAAAAPNAAEAATINGDLEPITPFTTYVGDDGVLSNAGNTYWNSLPTTTLDLDAEDTSPTPVDYIFMGAVGGPFAGSSGHDLYDEGYNNGLRFRIADLLPTEVYDLAFYLSSAAAAPGAEVSVLHGGGGAIQTQTFASTNVTPGAAGQEYLLFSGLAPYDTVVDGYGFDIALDNPFGITSAMVGFQIRGNFIAIPEPATATLALMACCVGLMRLRRNQ